MTHRKGLTLFASITLGLGLMLFSWNSQACKDPDCKAHAHKKGHSHAHGKGHSHAHGKAHKHAAKKSTNKLLRSYDSIRIALAADNITHAKQAAKQVIAKAGKLAKGKLGKNMVAAAKGITASKGIAQARLAFGQLSKHVIAYLKANPKQAKGVQTFFCPMAKGYKKWIQVKGTMGNPYMGKKMLMCGSRAKI